MARIPMGYELHPTHNRGHIESVGYKPWTVADLREILADFPDHATVWWGEYDDAKDDIIVQPIESSHGTSQYLILG